MEGEAITEEAGMKIEYSEAAKPWGESPEGRMVAEKLQEVLKRATDPVEIRWDRVEDDDGRPVYELTLSDAKASVSDQFSPEDLKSPTRQWHWQYRLYSLWGDLLQVWNHQQIAEMKASRD